ncbi:MAG: DUF5652 family protein [bacterium]|nr:DUF5652 family protein [bacterium]
MPSSIWKTKALWRSARRAEPPWH